MPLALQLSAIVDIDTIDAVGLGTLLLAAGTFWLALLTWRLLKAARDDRQTALDALRASNQQADAALQAVKVSERQAEIAERSRLDATAPLLGLHVELAGVDLADSGDRFGQVEPLANHAWPDGQLHQVRLVARVTLTLWNWGTSPAHVFFPSLIPEPENLLRKSGGSRYLVIPPGGHYDDIQLYRLTGVQAAEGVPCEIVVTCNGPIHGATFDTLRWRGTLQPLRLEAGKARRNDQIPLNAGPAQFVREYPALDRPDEMRKLAEHVRLGKRQG